MASPLLLATKGSSALHCGPCVWGGGGVDLQSWAGGSHLGDNFQTVWSVSHWPGTVCKVSAFLFQQGGWGTSRRVRKIIYSPGSVHHSEQRLGTRLTPWVKLAILNLTLLHRFSFFSPDMQSELQCQLRMSSCAVEEAPVSMSTSPVRLSDWRSGGRKGRRGDGREEGRYRRNKQWKIAMAPNG